MTESRPSDGHGGAADSTASRRPVDRQGIRSGGTSSRPAFAHASEAELARILDFYDVRWAYEPDTFPIGWSLDGEVVESFSPDFYLPDLDIYVELTTLKQSLVRKKNRKLRRLRELYPDVRIKLFYARDFRQLLLKFGRLALAAELTGTEGQATPPRATTTPTEDAAKAGIAAASRPTAPSGADGDARDATAPEAEPEVGVFAPTADPADPARTARGRRRGHRHRAAVRAAAAARAAAASGAPHDGPPGTPRGSVTSRPPSSVPSAGILPG